MIRVSRAQFRDAVTPSFTDVYVFFICLVIIAFKSYTANFQGRMEVEECVLVSSSSIFFFNGIFQS